MAIIKEFPMLFKKAKTGKIVSYRLLVTHANNEGAGAVTIVKQTGQLLGKKTVHEEVVTKGKNIGKANETTPKEQALSQAESSWRSKKDEGYKDLAELNYPGNQLMSVTAAMSPEMDAIVAVNAFLVEAITENTDASGNIKPMLADKYKGLHVSEFPVFMQPKLDGVRCIAYTDRSKEVTLLSRGGKTYNIPHIQQALSYLINESIYKDFFEKYNLFDGEIYSHIIDFEDLTSAVKKLTAFTSQLEYCIYDIPIQDLPFKEAFDIMQKLKDIITDIKAIYPSFPIRVVPTTIINSPENVDVYNTKCLDRNYEGSMIRLSNSKYQRGVRSSGLLKNKIFDTTEFPLIKFVCEGHRGVRDLKAVVETAGGQAEVPMNGSVAYKEALWKDWQDGKVLPRTLITVKHFKLTAYNQPRFPKGVAVRDYE